MQVVDFGCHNYALLDTWDLPTFPDSGICLPAAHRTKNEGYKLSLVFSVCGCKESLSSLRVVKKFYRGRWDRRGNPNRWLVWRQVEQRCAVFWELWFMKWQQNWGGWEQDPWVRRWVESAPGLTLPSSCLKHHGRTHNISLWEYRRVLNARLPVNAMIAFVRERTRWVWRRESNKLKNQNMTRR